MELRWAVSAANDRGVNDTEGASERFCCGRIAKGEKGEELSRILIRIFEYDVLI